jgi:hypothetical protein
MTAQIPILTNRTVLTTARAPHVMRALISDAGEQASWRYIEFLTANIRNANTRRA